MVNFKEFWYSDIDDYLKMSDNYDNPKTVKMYEISTTERPAERLFRAVTYLRTAVIGFQKTTADMYMDELAKKCQAHNHCQGIILEIGRVE